jgi:dihydropteroate synthase
VRKFLQRARQYILAYQALHSQEESEQQQPSTTSRDTHQITPMKIESLVKDFKTHRCVLDFDKGFIKTVIQRKSLNNYLHSRG